MEDFLCRWRELTSEPRASALYELAAWARIRCRSRCQKIRKSLLRGAGEYQAMDLAKMKQRRHHS